MLYQHADFDNMFAPSQLALANKVLIPSLGAVKFPELEVNFSDGRCVKLPICSGETEIDTNEKDDSCVSLVCLSFRASSQVFRTLYFVRVCLLGSYPLNVCFASVLV